MWRGISRKIFGVVSMCLDWENFGLQFKPFGGRYFLLVWSLMLCQCVWIEKNLLYRFHFSHWSWIFFFTLWAGVWVLFYVCELGDASDNFLLKGIQNWFPKTKYGCCQRTLVWSVINFALCWDFWSDYAFFLFDGCL